MALNAQKCRDALAHLGHEQPVFVDAPVAFNTWLTAKQLPTDVVKFLLETAVADHIPFLGGCGGMWTPEDVMVLNDQESDILAGGLLAVGSAINGDFIVIDLRDEQRQAGFVSHDELARNDDEARSWTDVREIFVPVAVSLHEMLEGISAQLWECSRREELPRTYPIDFCDAFTWDKKNK
jgi:hypothetical protein